MKRLMIVHGLTETDGDSQILALIETDRQKHQIISHLKNFTRRKGPMSLISPQEIQEWLSQLPHTEVKDIIQIQIDECL